MASGSGVYCGPLRLLAWEVHERLNAQGVPCNLLTGQERREVAGAAHTACTVEMSQLDRHVDVLVLDEIQMLAHAERGGAWSRAFLGARAAEVHVCGSLDAVPLVRRLAALCGDAVEEHAYERLAPLELEPASLGGDVRRIGRGDCVVAFGRRQLYALKASIEAATRLHASIVYGALPPETRQAQAELFNAADGGGVLVASDAVGMGLNLEIGRIVFASFEKFDGQSTRGLTPAEAQQIAGRAGRYGSKYGAGRVAALHGRDLAALRGALATASPPLQAAGLAPTFEQLQSFARALGLDGAQDGARRAQDGARRRGRRRAVPFAALLRAFEEGARVDGDVFFCCSLDQAQRIADVVEEAPLSLRQRHALCQAPLDVPDDALHTSVLGAWGWSVARAERIRVRAHVAPPPRAPRTHAELADLESYHRLLDAYLWLAAKFPHCFFQPEEAMALQSRASSWISQALEALPPPPPRPQRRTRGFAATTPPAPAVEAARVRRRLRPHQEKRQERRAAKRAARRAERRQQLDFD